MKLTTTYWRGYVIGFLSGAVGTILLASSAFAQAPLFKQKWDIGLSTGACPSTIVWADSGFPDDPYPSGNWMQTRLFDPEDDFVGFKNEYNFEVVATVTYAGAAHCAIKVTGLPSAMGHQSVGQGYNGSMFFEGVRLSAATQGYTQITPTTQPGNIIFRLSGVGKPTRPLMLSDMCSGCRWVLQGTAFFRSDLPAPVWP